MFDALLACQLILTMLNCLYVLLSNNHGQKLLQPNKDIFCSEAEELRTQMQDFYKGTNHGFKGTLTSSELKQPVPLRKEWLISGLCAAACT